ncbi:nodulation protein NodZ [Fundidesulfovibrio putealis]|uniref:nodulation protein NodZ n=1 Tax=Fundidesulfovibrio putealis TaxID=270496 RepID=UPI00040725EC|nr:nodulation protein NodZ [Fundidesulfovibrio putealis]
MPDTVPLKLFLYREGEHFQVPVRLGEAGANPVPIPLLQDLNGHGDCVRGRFVRAASPEDADYIVFPYVLDVFINVMRAMSVHYFIRQLPYFLRHERKHVFFHCQDLGDPLFTDGLILTSTPDRFNVDDPFQSTLPYAPGGHVLRNAPDFDFDAIDLDTSFVGALSGPLRYDLAQSICAEPGLRALIQHPGTGDWASRSASYLHMQDSVKKKALEDRFVSALRRSWTILCPRGNGSSSIRFYETLCMGRIPVHISDAYVPPFGEDIDYSQFCLFIPESDVKQAGRMLRAWLARRGKDELMAMCRRARQVWERHFRPENHSDVCLEYMRRHLPETKTQGQPRYQAGPGPLAADASLRIITAPGHYANMIADERRLWLNAVPQETIPPPGSDGLRSPADRLVGGVPSPVTLQELTRLCELARDVPENGTVACSGAPSGVLSIALANGLVTSWNFSSIVYGAEEWEEDAATAGASLAGYKSNIRQARVQDLVRTVEGGAEAFCDGCVHLAVLAGKPSDMLMQALPNWLGKIAPGGVLAIIPPDKRACCALAVAFARDKGLAVAVDADQALIVLRKPGEPEPPAALANRKRRLRPVRGAARLSSPKCQPRAPKPPAPAPDPHGQRFLVVKPTGGMGNRLLGLMCAVPYCLMTGRQLYVDWSDFMYSDRGENVFPRLFKIRGVPFSYQLPHAPDVYPDFWSRELTTNSLVEQLGIDHMDPKVMDATRIELCGRYPQTVAAFWSFNLDPMQAALDHIREHLPQFSNLTADGVCGHVMKQHILPRPAVSDQVDEFAAKHFTGPMIGVHIRHTDMRMPLEETLRSVHALKQNMGARIFLATDNQTVERTLARQFGEDLVTMPKRYPDNGKHLHSHRVAGMTNYEKALDAAVEMYLLARCDAIVRYQPSTFALVSWYISDIPAERVFCVQ